jgi:hypothetical protein
MARQQLTKTAFTGPYPTAASVLTETAEDTTNHTAIAVTDKTVIVIHNTHASSPFTYTITSVADASHGRTGDITTAAIAAGVIRIIGPLGLDGWRQTDGNLYVSASDVTVKFAAYETA